jgi:hypothetical protein
MCSAADDPGGQYTYVVAVSPLLRSYIRVGYKQRKYRSITDDTFFGSSGLDGIQILQRICLLYLCPDLEVDRREGTKRVSCCLEKLKGDRSS